MSGFVSTWLPALMGQVNQAAPAPGANDALSAGSLWDMVVKGGPTMFAIGACSLFALALIVERAVLLRRSRVVPPGLLDGLKPLVADRVRALEYCNSNPSPMARVVAAAIRRRGQKLENVEKAVEEAGRRELMGLRQRMRVLGALPQVSTMLGLLGTVFGMIKTFQAVAASGQSLGKTEMLAEGIFEAWTCTAAGLLVAIPVLMAYHGLMGRIDALLVDLDRGAEAFVEAEMQRAEADALSEVPASAPAAA